MNRCSRGRRSRSFIESNVLRRTTDEDEHEDEDGGEDADADADGTMLTLSQASE